VHRAGGIMAILGELARAGLLHTDVPTVHSKTMAEALATWDVMQAHDAVLQLLQGGAGGVPTQVAFSQDAAGTSWTGPRQGLHPRQGHAFSQDGGLAVLYGNIAENGCIVKTAGVDESILKFTAPVSSKARTTPWPASSPTRSSPATWW
jgi:dihydroxy-acid dehydratase